MNMADYQKLASGTAIYPPVLVLDKDTDAFVRVPAVYTSLGLAGEAGEFSNKIKKVLRDSKGAISPELRADLSDELGDVLWYVAACASELDLFLGQIAENNIRKLESRRERNALSGSGDQR